MKLLKDVIAVNVKDNTVRMVAEGMTQETAAALYRREVENRQVGGEIFAVVPTEIYRDGGPFQ